MGDDAKNSPAADAQQGSADPAPTPAHNSADSAVSPAPPAGNKAETTTDQPAETSPEADATPRTAEEKKSSAEDTAATDADEGGVDASKPIAIVAASKKLRPPYKYDPDKITLRFLFANRDGLTVTVECKPTDTVGEVKGALMSVWPDGKFRNRRHVPEQTTCH